MSTVVNKRKRLGGGLAVTSKVFVRSRNGKATKIVREHYLRNDIPCMSQACKSCSNCYKPNAQGELLKPILVDNPLKIAKNDIGAHYIVVDTNVVLNAIDILESDKAFYDVIVPQTVLEEVRNKSFSIYLRLRTLCKNEEKRCVVFHNEFKSDTFKNRENGEIINDYNDRLIRECAKFYGKHMKKHNINTVLITNDKNNNEKAKNDGIISMPLKEYISILPNSNELEDMLPSTEVFSNSLQEIKYPDYYTTARLMGGIKNGTLYQGNINISSYNFLEGSITVPSFPKPLLIMGRENLNRAFNGDNVVVELLPKDKWKRPSTEYLDEEVISKTQFGDNEDENLVISDQDRRALAKEAVKVQGKNTSEEEKTVPTGRVVGIIKRSWRMYVGQIAQNSATQTQISTNSAKNCLVLLMDRSLPKVRIRTRRAKELTGKRIVVCIDSWPSTSKYPEGHFVNVLGEIEDKDAEQQALLLEHDVEYRPFSKNVLDCLPKEGHDWKVPEDLNADEQIRQRRDLRDKLICSIDPPGCVDIDDALHAQKLPNGNYEVGVHIADVTHFVKAGTALDQEGASRGTSVYLVDKRIDMLPMLLGTDLCSLKPYVERFAFSVIWELDENANIINVDYFKSIIKSREAFAYEQAQIRIDDKSMQDDLTQGMRHLLMLSKKLKQKRLDAGALNLASPEVKVHMDSETSDPGEVEIKKLLDTNSLVEEFMLLANISVARKIYDAYPQVAMLRRHAAPPSTNFEVLNDMLRVKKDLSISLENSKALADSLDRCIDPQDPYFNTLVRIMSTRCMMAAEYFASGNFSYEDFRHYGLAVDIYTHFTSPIRRYCDVVAHRQLAGAIGYEPLSPIHRDKDKMDLVVKNINKRHRNAQFAGRASIEYYVGQVMKNNESAHEGYVIKVFSNGIVVLVPKFGVESLIKLESLGDANTAKFYEDLYKLSFTNSAGIHREVSVFDKVDVFVKSVQDPATGKRKAQLVLK